MKSFVVDAFSQIFLILSWISPLRVLRWLIRDLTENNAFIDVWVLVHVVLAFLLFLVYIPAWPMWARLVIGGYGLFRTFEIVVVQVNILLFDAYRAKRAGRHKDLVGYRRIVILLVINYVEILFWFALIYQAASELFQDATLTGRLAAFSLSFTTMSSFGQSFAISDSNLAQCLILLQAGVGLFMAVAILSRFIGILPHQETEDESEKD